MKCHRWLRRSVPFVAVAVIGVVSIAATAGATPGTNNVATTAIDPASLPLGSMYHVVDQIGARTLWERGITGEGVNVAVVDSGVAVVAALTGADKVVAMADFSAEAGVPQASYVDTFGHGTHMSGIIAGRDPGADPALSRQHPEWFLGVAPDAGLISIKAGDNTGAVDVSQMIAGIDWVTEHSAELNIRVLNLSFSSDSAQTYLTDPLTFAVERAWKAGIVVVVAAGNDGLGQLRVGVPANDPFVIAVGGVEAVAGGRYTIPDWATNGNELRNPDVGAPGAHIDSLRAPGSRIDVDYPDGRVSDTLFRGSGSSQAAAVTSGAVALLLQAQPSLTPDQVKAKLKRSADSAAVPFGSAVYAGNGFLRIDRAVDASSTFSSQLHLPATGMGSLDAARGTLPRLGLLGVPIVGEITVLGSPWLGSAWTGTRWTGGMWDGTRWTGAAWMGTRWTDGAWAGTRWTGTRWTGVEWAGTRWTGEAWTSSSWTGTRWTGTEWTGTRWTGTRWTNTSWG
jgi:serine protease AprX